MSDLKDRLKEAETTVPGLIGLFFLAVKPVYDTLLGIYGQLQSMGIKIELTEMTMMKFALAAVCVWLVITKIKAKCGTKDNPIVLKDEVKE